MTETAVLSLATDLYESEIPYPRSWIDRLVQGINRIPGPTWLFYIVALLTFALLGNAVFWVDGSLEVGEFEPVRVLGSFFWGFPVALYHHLSLVAGWSFRDFRPLLKSSESELRTLEYRLTTLPRRLGWLAILIGIAGGIASVQSDPETYGLDKAMTLLPEMYSYVAQSFVIAAGVALIAQIIRQLRLVNELHRQVSEIDLFQLAPVHAFATLTARAGIGLLIFMVFNTLLEISNITAAPF